MINGKVTAKNVEKSTQVEIKESVEGLPEIYDTIKITVDPEKSFINPIVANEKLLHTKEDFQTLQTEKNRTFSAVAWKNDVRNSKIAITATCKKAENVRVNAEDFKNENGDVLSNSNIKIKWLKNIRANIGMVNPNAPIKEFPDIIHLDGNKNIDADSVEFAWVQINIPEDTISGTYHGRLKVECDNLEKPIYLNYQIEVLDLTQPKIGNTEIQIWQHPYSVANYFLGFGEFPNGGVSYETKEEFYFNKEHFDLMRDSMKEYASLGGRDVVANIVEEAWNHQSFYGDLSMVKWIKHENGTWTFDYTWYDKWIEFMIETGVIDPENKVGQIKNYSIVPWDNKVSYFDENSNRMKSQTHIPGTIAWKELWTPFLEDFMKHSKEKGWFDITYIAMDERPLNELRPAVELIESIKDEKGKHFKISSALNYSSPKHYEFTDKIHDISININNTRDHEELIKLSNHRREKGLVTTHYSCTGNYPSNFIISDPGDNYWTMFYTATVETDGFLRWAWDNYVYDMHGDVSYRYWEPGDGWFIYPVERENKYTADKKFYSTPRYEMLKQGMRDYEKARFLLSDSKISEDKKEDLRNAIKVDLPIGATTKYGSRTYQSQEERMSIHNQTKRAYDKINEIARGMKNH